MNRLNYTVRKADRMKLNYFYIPLLLVCILCANCAGENAKEQAQTTISPKTTKRTMPNLTTTTQTQCFNYRSMNGMSMSIREARLEINKGYCTLHYTGFSRPDNFNFQCQLKGKYKPSGSFMVSGAALSYGNEKAAKAKINLADNSLTVDFKGGFGDEKITLQAANCQELEFSK